jgi:hypothetical protein
MYEIKRNEAKRSEKRPKEVKKIGNLIRVPVKIGEN